MFALASARERLGRFLSRNESTPAEESLSDPQGSADDSGAAKSAADYNDEATRPDPDHPDKVDSPTQIKKPSWGYTFKRAFAEFSDDNCTDLAAALTYYSVLALFPALIALISVLGLLPDSQQVMAFVNEVVGRLLPPDSAETISGIIEELTANKAAGWGLLIGLVGALWSASSYVGAFSRAMNKIYEVPEGRPVWKLRPLTLLLTLVMILLLAIVLVVVVASGPIATALGDTIGLGQSTLAVWNIAKWPVLGLVVVLIVALLYYATPNVQQPKFRWLSIGALIAIVVWVLASLGFGFYVSNFGSYNKTYGAVAGVVVLLLWLWLTNLALLFGAEVDTELERSRQLQAGIAAEETLQLPLRDARGAQKREKKQNEAIAEGFLLRKRFAREQGRKD